jgi:hypothetical protein
MDTVPLTYSSPLQPFGYQNSASLNYRAPTGNDPSLQPIAQRSLQIDHDDAKSQTSSYEFTQSNLEQELQVESSSVAVGPARQGGQETLALNRRGQAPSLPQGRASSLPQGRAPSSSPAPGRRPQALRGDEIASSQGHACF